MTTVIQARVDKSDRDEFRKILKKLGLTPSAGIKVFLKAVVAHKGIPFGLHESHLAAERAKYQEAYQDFKEGKSHTLDEALQHFKSK